MAGLDDFLDDTGSLGLMGDGTGRAGGLNVTLDVDARWPAASFGRRFTGLSSTTDEAEEQGGGGKEDLEGAETRLYCPGRDGAQPHPDV